jgi:hypothetical protein
MNVQQPQPNPALVEQQQQATQIDSKQIQQSLGQDTQNLWNMFGNGTQLSYVNMPSASGAPAQAGTATAAAK